MKRDHDEPVTQNQGFTILVYALPPQRADGKATFMAGGGSTIDVRAVSLKELRLAVREMSKAEGEQFSALLALRGALEACDNLALGRATERLGRVRQLDMNYQKLDKRLQKFNRQMDKLVAPIIHLHPELRSDTEIERSPSWLLSSEVSRMVGFNAQLVLWEARGAFRPAICCSDLNTAVYIHTFLIAPMGELGFRACPYDGDQFFQDRPNQDYCCPAHREAHRVARFRARRKQDSNKEKKNGRKDGTQEAR
jgi:hypothetical protein